MSKKILLFGGSFNPPHLGHKMMVQAAVDIIRPEKTILIPCGVQPLKGVINTPAQHRIKMLELLFSDKNNCDISDYEIKKTGPSFTVDTIEYFESIYKGAQLFFIMGLDSFKSLCSWKKCELILKKARLIVFSRDKTALNVMQINDVCNDVFMSERMVYRNFSDKAPADGFGMHLVRSRGSKTIYFVAGFKIDVSSSEIRAGQFNKEFVSEPVMQYIEKNGLYGGSAK
jgi:nicotinate-nucleotide adenylyltransferase